MLGARIAKADKLTLCFSDVPWKTARFDVFHAPTNLFSGRRDFLESAGPVRNVNPVNRTDTSRVGMLSVSNLESFAHSVAT